MKVLIVDDDVVSRMMLMHLVDSCGSFEIHEAEDGEDAWRQLEGGLRPQILFCDLRMPRLSGMELLGRVRAHPGLAALPFVLVSAANERDTVDEATELGADGYIVKPFQPAQVRAHLDALAGAPGGDEDPAATLARLGIEAARLAAYLGGLQRQLEQAGPELGQLLARGDATAASERIARLAEGCRTLGLHGAAAALLGADQPRGPASGGARPPDLAQLDLALEQACASAQRQAERLRALDPGA